TTREVGDTISRETEGRPSPFHATPRGENCVGSEGRFGPDWTLAMPEERLTEIPTNWTTISSAHTPGPKSQEAMGELVGRYHDALTRYIHLKVRDKHLADEVLQEFWTKLLTGKLAGADKTKGRFRDYLRTVLHRLIIDHF